MHAVSKAAKVILILYVGLRTVPAQRPPGPPSVAPRTEQALANWATPLASLKIRPGHFSEDEYIIGRPLTIIERMPFMIPIGSHSDIGNLSGEKRRNLLST